MNSITKTIIGAATVLCMQSCNMAKHYASLRISHNDEQNVCQAKQVSEGPDLKNNSGTDQISEIKKSIDSSEIYLAEKTLSQKDSSTSPGHIKKIKNSALHKTKIHIVQIIPNSSIAEKKSFHRKSFLKIKHKKLIHTATKGIDLDSELNTIYILLGVAAVIAIVGSIVSFSTLGIILLYILGGAAIICAAGIAMCLLLMGFLAMLGMNFFE